MRNRHQKIFLYKLPIVFNVDTSFQVMIFLLFVTFLSNTPPMLVPNCIHSDFLLLIQVQISLFQHLFLWKINLHLLNIKQTIYHRWMNTSSRHERFSNLRITIDNKQFTLVFFGRIWYWLIHLIIIFGT